MFKDLKNKVQKQFTKLVANGALFFVELDRDKVWDIYLQSIPEGKRQESTCSSCKSFLRQFGGICGISQDNKRLTLWDFTHEGDEYAEASAALRRYIASLPIAGPFFWEQQKCGTDKNPDKARNLVWEHFFLELPKTFVLKKDVIPSTVGSRRDEKNLLERALIELKPDAVSTTLELIAQGSLYRGNEFQALVQGFDKAQRAAKDTPAGLLDHYCWRMAPTLGAATSRIRNSSIGTLLVNLSEGLDLDAAVGKFEAVVAPSNYKRPTALITPRMIKSAEERLAALGLTNSLHRRQLSTIDLTAENALHVYRPKVKEKNIFAQLKQETFVHPKSLSKVEEISIEDFLSKVLPTVTSVKALVENSHMPNFVSLVGPQEQGPSLFKWGNSFSWSYAGDVADSIKERVKAAGGNVGGVIRISLSWGNYDDLDLHVHEPGYHIYFGNKRQVSPSGGMLDVDMNAGGGTSRQPVENICWQHYPTKSGEFTVVVNQYNHREETGDGFTVEIEHDGDVQSFSVPRNGPTGRNHEIAKFTYSKKDGFQLLGSGGQAKGYPSRDKWGLKTGMFHQVKAITLSPNHWGTNIGNKHFMFLLEGCKADEKVRGFYNEFLSQRLDSDRKVFEVLGSKVEVTPSQDELSGLGFSETQRNHLFVEVDGSFKRQLKIKF
jgi:hypothetical protein